ncbi:MAG: FAD-dependent oxidoreductase [Candidatus Eisenbacteria bacterium]|nr:FAD-dependent oxidoreductase [Candidatus Eisenbacteria bacterium]
MEWIKVEEARLDFPSGARYPISRIGPSPCMEACPAGVNVKAYVSLIAEGRYEEAMHVVRMNCPLPGVCGRVCNHPCESVCNRNSTDAPVAIRALKRFLADRDIKPSPSFRPPAPYRSQKIAVIGAGPAGLTCAYELARAGFPVTLLEAESEPGGMLRYGIPSYRLPRTVLDREIEQMLGPGIDLRTGVALGRDFGLDDLVGEGHKAIFLGVGASKNRRLGIPGESDFQGIEGVLRFLKRVNEGDRSPAGERVLVIGGGSSAIDAARTALRLGARSAEIVYRRSKEEMPAVEEEVRAAEAEGVRFRWLAAPQELKAKNWRVNGIECLEVRLGEPDASGRRRPIPVSGSGFVLPADAVISSIGQEAYLPFLGHRHAHAVSDTGFLVADPETGLTRISGVFAGGDVVTGPATVIEAIAAGRRAARSIALYVEGGAAALKKGKSRPGGGWELGLADPPAERRDRLHPPERDLEERLGFEEVELSFTEEEAREEASRCRRCGPCSECWSCIPGCERRHVLVRSGPSEEGNGGSFDLLLRTPHEGMPANTREGEHGGTITLRTAGVEEPPVLPVDVALVKSEVDAALCRGCGNCVEICAFGAPRLIPGPRGEPVSRIDPLACRGCGLCVSVCKTGAARIAPFSREWMLDEGARRLLDGGRPARTVVITCQRRGGCVAPEPDGNGERDVIRLSCAGQVDAGTILGLILRGAEKVVIAGCADERCRFERGAGVAKEQIKLARRVLALSGVDPECVRSDWSDSPEGDPLDWEKPAFAGEGSS